MSNKEILEKAITLAIDGGWNKNPQSYGEYMAWSECHLSDFLFDKDFAKALWGEDQLIVMFDDGEKRNVTRDIRLADKDQVTMFEKPIVYLGSTPGWMSHLQQMVIADSPIKYLGEHLND